MSPLRLLSWLFLLMQAESSCVGNSDCESDEICSIIKQCYGTFNQSDYESIITERSYEPTLVDTYSFNGIDVDALLDMSISTGYFFKSNVSIDFNANPPELVTPYDFITFNIPGERGYWIHLIEIVVSKVPDELAIFINGQEGNDFTTEINNGRRYMTFEPSSSYPFFAKNITYRTFADNEYTGYSINIYGTYDSPQPTSDPTEMPTEQSMAPTTAPTPSPSDSPTPAPTGYPTPDVCEEYVIKQPCCGNYNFTKQEDKINLRDSSLTTCNYTFKASCCGTLGGWGYTEVGNNKLYGCGGVIDPDSICRPSNFNTSINMTDDIVGTIITAKDNDWAGFLETTSESQSAINNNPNFCTCNYTTYECTGEDIAICGAPQDYEKLFAEDCWMNETWTDEDDFTNESCWKETVANDPFYEHLLWEPCSIDSFLGNVTSVDYISSEIILDNTCTCEYAIRDCRVLEDRQAGQCKKSDCNNDGECFEELANPCCATGFDYDYKNYTGVTPTIDEMTGLPIDDGWTCNNNMTALCPDIYNGTRKYETEYRVDWWYDMEQDEIISRCGCIYTTDECNLPTTDPTQDPTSDPTSDPTPEPTDVADHALLITISPAASLILAIIAAFVL